MLCRPLSCRTAPWKDLRVAVESTRGLSLLPAAGIVVAAGDLGVAAAPGIIPTTGFGRKALTSDLLLAQQQTFSPVQHPLPADHGVHTRPGPGQSVSQFPAQEGAVPMTVPPPCPPLLQYVLQSTSLAAVAFPSRASRASVMIVLVAFMILCWLVWNLMIGCKTNNELDRHLLVTPKVSMPARSREVRQPRLGRFASQPGGRSAVVASSSKITYYFKPAAQ